MEQTTPPTTTTTHKSQWKLHEHSLPRRGGRTTSRGRLDCLCLAHAYSTENPANELKTFHDFTRILLRSRRTHFQRNTGKTKLHIGKAPTSLQKPKRGSTLFLATRLGCVSGLATRGIVCESGLVGLDPPHNRVPEFVASDPKLWDVGNRLVGGRYCTWSTFFSVSWVYLARI
jgi:hypothetical protein